MRYWNSWNCKKTWVRTRVRFASIACRNITNYGSVHISLLEAGVAQSVHSLGFELEARGIASFRPSFQLIRPAIKRIAGHVNRLRREHHFYCIVSTWKYTSISSYFLVDMLSIKHRNIIIFTFIFLYFYWRTCSLLPSLFLFIYFHCQFFAVKLSIIPVCSRMKFTSVKRVDISNTKQCWQPRHRKDRLSDLWVTVALPLYAVFYSQCIGISRFTDEREPVQSGRFFHITDRSPCLLDRSASPSIHRAAMATDCMQWQAVLMATSLDLFSVSLGYKPHRITISHNPI